MKLLRRALTLSLCLAPALMFSSCASMFGDNTRSIYVSTNPEGASISIDGNRIGTTPTIIVLPSYLYGGKQIVLKKDDYSEQSIYVNPIFQPIGILNIFFFPGFLIDAATGNILKINPSQLKIEENLSPIEPAKKAKHLSNS